MTCPKLYEKLTTLVNSVLHTLGNINFPRNPIVVFDIDHTLVDGKNRPLQPIVDLYKHLYDNNIPLAIITARVGTPNNIKITQEMLHSYGIRGYSVIYFRPETVGGDARSQYIFKLNARKDLHDKGYTVTMSLGDKPWDYGEYGGIGVRIPICICRD